MKPSVLPAVGAVVLSLTAPCPVFGAEQMPATPSITSSDPFDALQRALRAESETKARSGGTSGMGSGREMYQTRSFLEGIRQAMNRGDDNNALSAISQIEAMTGSEDVRRACDALTEKIHKDRGVREQAFATEVEVATKRAGELVLSAKSPKELDGAIADFNRLMETRMTSDGRDARLQQKIQGTTNFLNRWQEYLAAQAKGDDQAANNALRNIGDNGYGQTLLIPRSEILARMSNTGESSGGRGRRSPVEINAAVGDILDHTVTLDDIPAALAKLAEITPRNTNGSPGYDNSSDLGAAITNLQAIQKTRAELQAGLATTINVGMLRNESGSRSAVESKFTGLRAELVKLALPRLLGAPGEKAADGEGVNEFLRRLVELAKKRGDWGTMSRGLDINRNFASGTGNYSVVNNQEADAYRQFFAGLNMEAAGQYTQAVIALLTALKSGVQDLPAASIGEHLAAIEKAHPKEFADGNTYVLNPPSPYQNSPYGPGGGMDPRFRRNGFPPGAAEQQTPAVITVPAASPSPSATATPAPRASP